MHRPYPCMIDRLLKIQCLGEERAPPSFTCGPAPSRWARVAVSVSTVCRDPPSSPERRRVWRPGARSLPSSSIDRPPNFIAVAARRAHTVALKLLPFSSKLRQDYIGPNFI
jgi:hypothetical protein